MGVRQASDHPQTQADGEPPVILGWFQRAIPARGVDADGAHLDPLGLGTKHAFPTSMPGSLAVASVVSPA